MSETIEVECNFCGGPAGFDDGALVILADGAARLVCVGCRTRLEVGRSNHCGELTFVDGESIPAFVMTRPEASA